MQGTITLNLETAIRDIVREEVRAALSDREEPSDWLSIRSASLYLDTSPNAVRMLVKRGEIPKYQARRGAPIRLRREDLDAYLQGGDAA